MTFFGLFSGIFAVNKISNEIMKGDCPDDLIQEECNGNCRMEFTRCRLLCETEYCLSICEREYDTCLNACPCGENCPEGCKNCDHPLCPEEAFPSIMVLLYTDYSQTPFVDLHNAFIIKGDGSETVQATIDAPNEQFLTDAKHALIKDVLYVFGAYQKIDNSFVKKVAFLDDCSFSFLDLELTFPPHSKSSTLTFSSGNEALICFSYSRSNPENAKTCNYFDGNEVSIAPMTTNDHLYAGLGFYNGQPTTVGSWQWDAPSLAQVEILTESGWIETGDHPIALYGHSLIGLTDGSMLSIGGYDSIAETAATDIWRLKNDAWTITGNLKKKVFFASALESGSSIYLVAGYGSDAPIQRIDLEETEVLGTKVIGFQPDEGVQYPVIMETTFDRCV
ncbi:Oidioi.mRNA.OKI2018_I69.chr2.g8380.t1.cds [Oikopleura dioica]|uniref:Oidioi.mRNA.OKI2018_I69.chr2.g8380.t1.cds n=1 Tax=Oikopleura dioica TaxID=34765 RepID=A0ABN7T928_OIKDI|nr:Oidioi.mRNA.OKI2018_I69.chr2.g8380.t1.cds [Oikopleura dioica]